MTSEVDSMSVMDTAAQPRVRLKIPFNGGILRSGLFEDRHLTAMRMAQALKSDNRKVGILLSAVANLLGEDEYVVVAEAVLEGSVDYKVLSDLLHNIVTATAEYRKAQASQPELEPEPETLDL